MYFPSLTPLMLESIVPSISITQSISSLIFPTSTAVAPPMECPIRPILSVSICESARLTDPFDASFSNQKLSRFPESAPAISESSAKFISATRRSIQERDNSYIFSSSMSLLAFMQLVKKSLSTITVFPSVSFVKKEW